MAFGPIPACFILFIAENCLPLLGNAPPRRLIAHSSSSNIGEGSAFTEGVSGASVSGLVPPGKPATEGTRGFFMFLCVSFSVCVSLRCPCGTWLLSDLALGLPSDCVALGLSFQTDLSRRTYLLLSHWAPVVRSRSLLTIFQSTSVCMP